ncbi:hypothetical protein [Luteolibacter sp. Populi]|uniref:hypothetical protein n=1 Tax=Luteolibacter sp. Populi TaxID=3230487 RepID=UPI0034657F95
MIRFLAIFLLCASLSGRAVSAPPVMDPEVDYLAYSERPLQEQGGKRSDTLWRLELDLEGSGKKSVFLTYSGFGDRSGNHWTAYIPRDGAKGYDRGGDVTFRWDFQRAGKFPKFNPTGGVLGVWVGKGGSTLFRYRLIDRKLVYQEMRDLDYGKPEEVRYYKMVFGRDPAERERDDIYSNPPFAKVPVSELEKRRELRKTPVK